MKDNRKFEPNLIKNKNKAKTPHPVLVFWGKIYIGLTVTVLLVLAALSIKVISSISTHESETGEKVSFFQQLTHLLTKKDKAIKGEALNRINILLLGMGGAGHQGALLTDTIILVSFKPSTEQVALISIPRDLVVDIPGYYFRKINNALALGREMKYPGGGEALVTDLVSDMTNLPIHYYARVDFTGFKQVIDGLGGLKINIERSFTDHLYPTSDYGYQTVSFKAGEQIMNGKDALRYVRSRHGNNNEGSDFARAKRQQKVLMSLKEKTTAFSTLINPSKISEILSTLGNHTKTDMEIWEMLRLYNLLQNTQETSIITKVIDNSEGGLLKTEVGLEGAYILVPSAEDYSEIQYMAKNIFSQGQIDKEKAKIAIENGTSKVGLAKSKALELESLNYNVIETGNYKNKDIEKTIIFDNTRGKKPHTLAALKEKFNAVVYSDSPVLFDSNNDQVPNINSLDLRENLNRNSSAYDFDFLIILGQDSLPKTSLSYY